MTEAEADAIHSYVGEAVERTMTEAIEHIAERHAEAARQVGIALSPLEKFLERRVLIEMRDQEWDGTLVNFGPGWLEIRCSWRGRMIIHTGGGMSLRLFDKVAP